NGAIPPENSGYVCAGTRRTQEDFAPVAGNFKPPLTTGLTGVKEQDDADLVFAVIISPFQVLAHDLGGIVPADNLKTGADHVERKIVQDSGELLR
ncbi:MAG: hypothetical protein MUC76_15115, partial [Spirochaetes bacterium]|nr:hypothetical protein [Spirochaetota bacterium]